MVLLRRRLSAECEIELVKCEGRFLIATVDGYYCSDYLPTHWSAKEATRYFRNFRIDFMSAENHEESVCA